MKIHIRITKDNYSQEIAYNHMIDQIDLENLIPKRMFPGMHLLNLLEVQRSEELRRKFIDMLSSKISYALTDYLINKINPDKELEPIINYKDSQLEIK